VASRLAADTSQLYARNVLNFLELLIDKETKELAIDMDDEIIKGTLVTRDGAVVHPALAPAEPKEKAAPAEAAEDGPEEDNSDGE
jgi:NAD(P) transhydrogenase subunit alpha